MTTFDKAWDLTKIYMRDSKGNHVVESQGGHIKGSSYPPGPPDLNEYLAQEAEKKYEQEQRFRRNLGDAHSMDEKIRAMEQILMNYADFNYDEYYSDPKMTLNMLMGVLDMKDYHKPEFMPRRG